MGDGDFVPFTPRLIRRDSTYAPSADSEPNATDPVPCAPQPCEQQPNEPNAEALAEAPDEALAEAPDEALAEASDDPQEDLSPTASPFSIALEVAIQSSTRDAEIRCAAIRLACIATGRILRHAVAFDPQIVARFVDDAILAARRDDAFVRVDCIQHAASSTRGRSFRQDERLDTGEVALDFPSGGLGATLEERAALAVRAAADA